MMQSDDDCYYENRLSSCIIPPLMCMDIKPRRSVCYNKLYQEPLSLTVVKLDASSFGIEVARSGTVGELKRAVEASFRHLPKKGPGRVSWKHVWGQFCLCHEGHKLLNDSDYIGGLGIKDGDQLHFVHHTSTTYSMGRTKSDGENLDSDGKPSVSVGYKYDQQDDEKDHSHCIEILEENQDDNANSKSGDDSTCEYKLSSLLRGWFPYCKLTSSQKAKDEKSRLSSFKNVIWFYRNKSDSWTQTQKEE